MKKPVSEYRKDKLRHFQKEPDDIIGQWHHQLLLKILPARPGSYKPNEIYDLQPIPDQQRLRGKSENDIVKKNQP